MDRIRETTNPKNNNDTRLEKQVMSLWRCSLSDNQFGTFKKIKQVEMFFLKKLSAHCAAMWDLTKYLTPKLLFLWEQWFSFIQV